MYFVEDYLFVDAIKWTWDNWNDICDLVPIPGNLFVPEDEKNKDYPALLIKTNNGWKKTNYGDYIIRTRFMEYDVLTPQEFQKEIDQFIVISGRNPQNLHRSTQNICCIFSDDYAQKIKEVSDKTGLRIEKVIQFAIEEFIKKQ